MKVNTPDSPHILALISSPRPSGNTDTLCDEVLRPLRPAFEVQKLYLHELKIAPCLACGACAEDGRCVQEDDLGQVVEHLRRCRALLIGSPMYAGTVTAQLKALMDRCDSCCLECLPAEEGRKRFRSRLLSRSGPRPGAVVAVCDLSSAAELQAMARIMELFLRDVGFRSVGRVTARLLSEPGDARRRPDALAQARELGERLKQVLLHHPPPAR